MPRKKFFVQTIFLVSIIDYNKLKYYLFPSLKLKKINGTPWFIYCKCFGIHHRWFLKFIMTMVLRVSCFWLFSFLIVFTKSFVCFLNYFVDTFVQIRAFNMFVQLTFNRPPTVEALQPPCSVSNLITNTVRSSSK